MEVPLSLAPLVSVDTEFAVLLCRSPRCAHAQNSMGIAEHFRKHHHKTPAIRRQALEFGQELARQDVRFLRGHADVQLPVDGSLPQPIIPVVDGFSCRLCRFLTTNRTNIRKHANKKHSKQRKKDNEIFTLVRLQSWYGRKKERYWVVDDATKGVGEATRGFGEATKGFCEATRGLGEATKGFCEVTRGIGEATKGLGDATMGFCEVTRGIGEATKGLGDATMGSGEATRGLGEATKGLGDATMGSGEATRGLGEATRGLCEATRGIGEATKGLGDATMGSGEATRGLGEATRGLCEATRGIGEATKGLGDATTGSGEATRALAEATKGLGDATRGIGEATKGLGEATRGFCEVMRGIGEATKGLGDATTGSGEATRGLGEATRGIGEATKGLGDATTGFGEATKGSDEATNRQYDAANELNGIKADVQQWRAEATERRLTLQVEPLVYELDPWLNFTKWHAVLSKSKHDMLQTYEFLRYPTPAETKLRRLLRAWDIIKARALETLEDVDHKDALKWWVSPKNEVASQHPFELPQSLKTLDRYSRMWEQFICYMLRTVPPLPDEDMDSGKTTDLCEATETGIVYTKEQRRVIEDIHDFLDDDTTEEGLPALANELMALCRLVITQDLSASKLYDSPLMHYLAVRGIDEKAEGFRGPMEYTNILAGVLWMVRLLALELAIPSKPWPELGILGKGELASVKDTVKAFRLAHLVEGSFSPASSILTQLAKGQKDNAAHQSPANIHWAPDKQTVFFAGRPVHLPKIGPMCNALVDVLRESLLVLAFDEKLPTIQLSRVVDSTAWTQQFRKANYNFTKHVANSHLDVDYMFNLQRAQAAAGDLQMLAKVKGGGGEVSWIQSRKHWYLSVEKLFLRRLMVAVHITAGQPARGPELGSIKVSNSSCSARNIIILNGRVCVLTMYDNSRRRRGNTNYILRVLPDDLSQLVAQYIVFIRPFARVLDRRESEYLFADVRGPWAGDQLSRELANETTKHLGVRLTVRQWRHVAIGIAVQWLGRAGRRWEKDDEDEGDGQNEPELPDMDDGEEFPASVVDHIMVRQASHGQRVAQNTYAINGAFLHRLGPQLIAAFEYASVAWHNLFDWKSEGSRGDEEWAKRKRPANEQPAEEELKRRKREAEAEVDRDAEAGTGTESEATIGLRRIYGPEATFKSEGQADAMELVHDPRRMTNIIVLPTSAGKTALFLSVAAMSTHKSVVVVVPFAQLVTDIVRQALDCGLGCMQWKDGSSAQEEPEQLIVVSADQASSDAFLHYARGLDLSRSLAHLFFDECHVAITDTSYRKRLRELWQLRYLDCPFTCLTATLMVALEGKLRKQLMLPETQIFRRSTVRPRIRYGVVDSGRVAPMKLAIDMVKGRPLRNDKKGVIYVRTYGVGDVISDQLRCPFYKATAVDKNETLQQWIDEPGGWIVATGALGTGINIEGIIEVILPLMPGPFYGVKGLSTSPNGVLAEGSRPLTG